MGSIQWSWRSNLISGGTRLSMAGYFPPLFVGVSFGSFISYFSPDTEKVLGKDLAFWQGVIEMPCLLNSDVQTVQHQWPPPFLGSNPTLIVLHILILLINTPHCLIVLLYGIWLRDIDSLTLFLRPPAGGLNGFDSIKVGYNSGNTVVIPACHCDTP